MFTWLGVHMQLDPWVATFIEEGERARDGLEHIRLVPVHHLQAQGDAESIGPVPTRPSTPKLLERRPQQARGTSSASRRAPRTGAGESKSLSISSALINSASSALTLSGSAVLISACSGRPTEAATSSDPPASTRRAAATSKA